MQLLYPIGLISLASVLMPIIIHLWRVKQGKTLKIGSITLLGESAAATAKNLKISQWLLLLLRCLFFILLAILISKPFLTGKSLSAAKGGWILVARKDLKPIYNEHQKTIDSLLQKGYQLRNFTKGFGPIELKDTAKNYLEGKFNDALNYTSLLKQANHLLPNQYPVWIFANKQLSKFDDVLPSLHLKINWKAVKIKDIDTTTYTQFIGRTFKATKQQNATSYHIVNPKEFPPLAVVVNGKNKEDEAYLRAALEAIGSYLNQPIVFRTMLSDNQLDAIFWLSDTPIPMQLMAKLKPDGITLQYANTPIIKQVTRLTTTANKNTDAALLKMQNEARKSDGTQTIWKDVFGNPVLTVKQEQQRKSYQLYTQFNPKWTTLVWKDDFAEALMPILYGEKPTGFAFKSIPQADQEQPIAIFNKDSLATVNVGTSKSLDQLIWIMAFVVLLLERIISYSTKN